jgi:4,5-dihydroxyphthalate decarboxylase
MEIERLPKGEKVEEALLRGEIDACMLPEINPKLARHTPGVRRLWPNFREVERAYYLRTKIFPIRHVVVVKNSILARYPWVARNLVEAFTQAKEMGIRHVRIHGAPFLRGTAPSWKKSTISLATTRGRTTLKITGSCWKP